MTKNLNKPAIFLQASPHYFCEGLFMVEQVYCLFKTGFLGDV